MAPAVILILQSTLPYRVTSHSHVIQVKGKTFYKCLRIGMAQAQKLQKLEWVIFTTHTFYLPSLYP